jgi:hypothetical protein
MISSPGILRPQPVRIYWSRRQAQTRRNIFRRRPAEEAVAVVGVAGVVVGEDGEKEGMGKWMLTRVRKAVVGPLCGLFALFKALPIIAAKSANAVATDQYTSCAFFVRALHSPYTPGFSTPVYLYSDLSSGKTIF